MPTKYVPHPRYGDKPKITGMNPHPDTEGVYLHPNTRLFSTATINYLKQCGSHLNMEYLYSIGGKAIPGTAIVADTSRQGPATLHYTHYYDIGKICRGCKAPFIFYAEEQKYWYEDLQFPLEADCVRCHPCRTKLHEIQKTRLRYEALCRINPRSADEDAEQAECRLSLVEEGVFSPQQLEQVRAFLNRYPDHHKAEAIRASVIKLDSQARAFYETP